MPLRGTVTDNADPQERGRCRVRVWGVHKEEDPNLPWAEIVASTSFGLSGGIGVTSILQVGTSVWVDFEQGDIQCPIILGVFIGSSGDEMSDISPENSDIDQTAGGDNYGLVQTINTPSGNRLELNDKEPRIHLTTGDGFEVDLDQENRKIRIGTPCGPEIKLDCNDKSVFITNGQATMTMQGPAIQVQGYIYADGVFAPNLCYCDEPGSPPEPRPTLEEQKETKENECNPASTPDGSKNTCTGKFPPENNPNLLDPDLKRVLEKAQQLYKQEHHKEMKVHETKMSSSRYVCLSNAGENPNPAQIHGGAVKLLPHDEESKEESMTPDEEASTSGCFTDVKDLVHYKDARGKPLCYLSNDPEIRALARTLYSEVRGTGTSNDSQDPSHNVASVIFNRIKTNNIWSWVKKSRNTVAGQEAQPGQFDHTRADHAKYRIIRKANLDSWIRSQKRAEQLMKRYRSGNWQDSTKGSVFFLNEGTSKVNPRNLSSKPLERVFIDPKHHSYYRHKDPKLRPK